MQCNGVADAAHVCVYVPVGEGDSKFQLPVPIIIPIPFPPEDTDKEAHAQPKEEALGMLHCSSLRSQQLQGS